MWLSHTLDFLGQHDWPPKTHSLVVFLLCRDKPTTYYDSVTGKALFIAPKVCTLHSCSVHVWYFGWQVCIVCQYGIWPCLFCMMQCWHMCCMLLFLDSCIFVSFYYFEVSLLTSLCFTFLLQLLFWNLCSWYTYHKVALLMFLCCICVRSVSRAYVFVFLAKAEAIVLVFFLLLVCGAIAVCTCCVCVSVSRDFHIYALFVSVCVLLSVIRNAAKLPVCFHFCILREWCWWLLFLFWSVAPWVFVGVSSARIVYSQSCAAISVLLAG